MHLSDAVLESVMVFRLGAGAVAEVVVPLCLAKYIYIIYFILYIIIRPSGIPSRIRALHLIDACAHPWSFHDSDPTKFTKNYKIKIKDKSVKTQQISFNILLYHTHTVRTL